jgi:F0F1-type ATP synthase membrane subunit b/b'
MKGLYLLMFFSLTACFYCLIGKTIDERKKYVKTNENSLKSHSKELKEAHPINNKQKSYYEYLYKAK